MATSFRRPPTTEAEIERRDRADALCKSIAYKGKLRRKDIAFRIGVDNASLSIWTRGLGVVPEYVIDRLLVLEKEVEENYQEDESTLKERLRKYIAYRGLTISAFENAAQLSAGYVYALGDSIFDTTLAKISRAFPDLNPEWLRTGKGDMLNGYAVVVATDKDAKKRILELQAEIRVLKEEVDRLRRQNSRLVEKLLDKQ